MKYPKTSAFLTRLSELFPQKSVSKTLAAVSGVSTSAAYRKMKGQLPLTLDEALALASALNANPAALLQSLPDAWALVHYPASEHPGWNEGDFLHNLLEALPQRTRLWCATPETPLPLLLRYPALAAFKLQADFMETAKNAGVWSQRRIKLDLFDENPTWNERRLALLDRFERCPAEWTVCSAIFDVLLRQLSYFKETKLLNEEQHRQILTDVRELLQVLKKSMISESDVAYYLNDLVPLHPIVFWEGTPEQPAGYVKIDPLTLSAGNDEGVMRLLMQKADGVRLFATRISETGTLAHYQWLEHVEHRLAQLLNA